MPELPEVETVRRTLEPAVTNRVVRGTRFTPEGARLLQGVSIAGFSDYIAGRRILRAERRGKYLLFPLDDGRYFVAHLRMTGRMEVEPACQPDGQFFRAALVLEDGNELRWRDVRRFGTWETLDSLDELNSKLGPEPLEDTYTAGSLAVACRGRKAPIKSVLLDQRRVAGMGNIYVDEALFRASIHPLRSAGGLDSEELTRLHEALRAVLFKGIENFGTTLRDFVNAYGQEGRNREYLQVYARKGEPCFRCDSLVERIVVGGRGTHFCPRCQFAPAMVAST